MPRDLSYTTAATATAGETTQVRSADGRLELTVSTPVELGGAGGEATNAEQLLAAGYAACFLSALKYAAVRRGIELPPGCAATATLDLTHPDAERFAVSIRVEAALPGLQAEVADRLIEEAKVAWPYAEAVVGSGAPQQDRGEDAGRGGPEAGEGTSGARGYGG